MDISTLNFPQYAASFRRTPDVGFRVILKAESPGHAGRLADVIAEEEKAELLAVRQLYDIERVPNDFIGRMVAIGPWQMPAHRFGVRVNVETQVPTVEVEILDLRIVEEQDTGERIWR